MRFAAGVFWSFSLYLVIVILAVLFLNPSAGTTYFAAQTLGVFGGLCAWSAFAAWRLARGKGILAACLLAGLLTQIVLVGWAHYGALQLKERVHPVLLGLRTVGGVYVVLLWCAIAWAVRQKSAANQPTSRQGKANTAHEV